MTFESLGVAGGCWSGTLHAANPPASLAVVHRGQVVAQARAQGAGPGLWAVTADLPSVVIDEGVHSLLLVAGEPDAPASQVLGSLTLIAGRVAGEDVLAEVAQLRAELDLLKREFRRLAAGG